MRPNSICFSTTRATSLFTQTSASTGPPFLAVWGRNDPFFLPAGAEAYKRDLPDAEIQFLDTGHFALETHAPEIAEAIGEFLERPGVPEMKGAYRVAP